MYSMNPNCKFFVRSMPNCGKGTVLQYASRMKMSHFITRALKMLDKDLDRELSWRNCFSKAKGLHHDLLILIQKCLHVFQKHSHNWSKYPLWTQSILFKKFFGHFWFLNKNILKWKNVLRCMALCSWYWLGSHNYVFPGPHWIFIWS